MPVAELDLQWLLSQADDQPTVDAIHTIVKLREQVFTTNRMPTKGEVFELHLNGVVLNMPLECSFSLIELYEEAFRKNDHFLHNSFVPQNGEIILDIGANCGLYTLGCKTRASESRLFCFEPFAYTFSLLTQNMALNNLQSVSLSQCAVGESCGQTTFTGSENYPALSGKALTGVERPWFQNEWLLEDTVELLTVEDILLREELPFVDIMKIDVEGSECDVLAGAVPVLDRVDRIIVEYHSATLKRGVMEVCMQNGFRLLKSDDSGSYYGDLYFMKR